MFCTKPRPWRRLRLGVAPFGGVLSEKAGDRLKEMIFGPCTNGFGFGSTGRASVVTVAAGREEGEDVTDGEGLRRNFGVETDSDGDLDLGDGSVSVRPGCDMDGNVFQGGSGSISLLSGLGVYECRFKLGVEDVEMLLWVWRNRGDCLLAKAGSALESEGLVGLTNLCRLGPGPEGVLIVRLRICSRVSRGSNDSDGLGEFSDSIFST